MRTKDERKQEQIFEATVKLIAEIGFGGITMPKIAKEARIATGTLYIYFKNKEELFVALYIHLKKESSKEAGALLQEGEPYKVSFKKVWFNFLNNSVDNFNKFVFMDQFKNSPYFTDEVKQLTEQTVKPFLDFLEVGKKELIIKDVDNQLIFAFMAGSTLEFVKMSKVGKVVLDHETKETIFSLFWDAIKA